MPHPASACYWPPLWGSGNQVRCPSCAPSRERTIVRSRNEVEWHGELRSSQFHLHREKGRRVALRSPHPLCVRWKTTPARLVASSDSSDERCLPCRTRATRFPVRSRPRASARGPDGRLKSSRPSNFRDHRAVQEADGLMTALERSVVRTAGPSISISPARRLLDQVSGRTSVSKTIESAARRAATQSKSFGSPPRR